MKTMRFRMRGVEWVEAEEMLYHMREEFPVAMAELEVEVENPFNEDNLDDEKGSVVPMTVLLKKVNPAVDEGRVAEHIKKYRPKMKMQDAINLAEDQLRQDQEKMIEEFFNSPAWEDRIQRRLDRFEKKMEERFQRKQSRQRAGGSARSRRN
jgi:hypothetical protein